MRAHINGITMHFVITGPDSAPPVVLHHPLATDLSFWDELTGVLAPRYRVVRFDARGHGESDAPQGTYGFETLTADVIGLMNHLGIGRAAFVGLSMGGMIGQHLGFLHADRFKCLILVSTSSRIPHEARSLWTDRVVVAREKGMVSQIEPAMARWLAPATVKRNPALVARLARMIETTPLEGYAGWCATIGTLDITDKIGAISLPTLIIAGAEDPGTPPAAAEAIHKEIKGSSFVVMPGVAHQLALEDPAAFHAHVLPFLDKHGAA
jgi:3-oxoadipate enol-lactonase